MLVTGGEFLDEFLNVFSEVLVGLDGVSESSSRHFFRLRGYLLFLAASFCSLAQSSVAHIKVNGSTSITTAVAGHFASPAYFLSFRNVSRKTCRFDALIRS